MIMFYWLVMPYIAVTSFYCISLYLYTLRVQCFDMIVRDFLKSRVFDNYLNMLGNWQQQLFRFYHFSYYTRNLLIIKKLKSILWCLIKFLSMQFLSVHLFFYTLPYAFSVNPCALLIKSVTFTSHGCVCL